MLQIMGIVDRGAISAPWLRCAVQVQSSRVRGHVFVDGHGAGRELGGRLASFAAEDPVVLGLARGGVPAAYEVAQALGAPLDVDRAQDWCAGNPE